MQRNQIFLATLLLCIAASASAITPDAAQKLVKDVTPSLVAVQYTWTSELGRRDFVGAGLVVSDDGLVIVSINLTPIVFPDEQMKDFKIIIPGDDLTEIDATFVGRDDRSNITFVRAKPDAKEKHTWVPVKFEDIPAKVGEEIYSVGMLGKTASYQAYFTHSLVSANLRGESRHVLVTAEGLAAVGAPVFNAAGKAIGWVPMQTGQMITINDPNPVNQLAAVYAPPRMFVPTKEFSISLADPPIAGTPLKLPWLGVNQMTGVKKEVAEYLGIKGEVAIQIGDVIEGTPADKAGLKSGNIILKLDGKPLERGDEPDEAAMILAKTFKKMKVGTAVTLSVITEPKQPPKDIKVVLAERPKQENQAKRFYAEDLGFASREIVFDDTYGRKLPADQQGVVVAIVKPSAAAQAGTLQRGDLVTKLNQTAITSLDQFKDAYQDFRKKNPKEAVVLEALRGPDNKTQIIRIEPPR